MQTLLRFLRNDGRPWLFAALAVYVALRAAILLTNFDAVAMPNYELGTIGNLAKVIADERGGAPQQMHFDNVGGHLVVGWLAAPLYALIGDRYLVLKLVPLVLGIGTLLLIWRLCRRHFDARTAVIAVFLFALAPPTLCKYSLIAKGNHFENLFFQMWFLNAFFDAHADPLRPRRLVEMGLAAGLALFCYTGALLLLATAAVVHVYLRGARASVRDAALVVPAFAVGIAPLVWLDFASGGRERNFLATRLLENRAPAGDFVERFAGFWTDVLPASPCFERIGAISGTAVGWVFLACFAAAWIALVAMARGATSRSERAKLVPFLAHLPLFAVLVAAFDFPFKPYGPPIEVGQYRYLVPHFALATVGIAIACARGLASARRGVRWLGGGLASVTLATGAFTLPIVKLDAPRRADGWQYDGYWFEYYSNVLLRDDPWTGARAEAYVQGFDPVDARRACAGVGFYLAWRSDTGLRGHVPTTPLDLREVARSFSPPYVIDAARGSGTYLRRLALEPNGGERLHGLLARFEADAPDLAPFCAEGLALDMRYPLVASVPGFLQQGLALRDFVPASLAPALHRGLGVACGRLAPRGLDREIIESIRRAIDPAHRASFAFGVGWGIAECTSRSNRAASLRETLLSEDRAAAWQGFGASLRHNLGPDLAAPPPDLAPDERALVLRGAAWPDYPRAFELYLD